MAVTALGYSEKFGLAPAGVKYVENGSVHAVGGLRSSAIHSGVRPSGRDDLAIVDTGVVGAAAGVFTSNLATAAPVLVSRDHLANGRARAIVANSGCANACTGAAGVADARLMAEATAKLLGCRSSDVLVASTGLIGYRLPSDAMAAAIANAGLGSTPASGHAAARAIMTTDSSPKEVAVTVRVGGADVTVAGMAKGAAMLSPSMATMLAFLFTDAVVEPGALQQLLTDAAAATFNKISVDACQSTNDTVVALSTGRGGNDVIVGAEDSGYEELASAVAEVCAFLAFAMISNGEGSTRVARVNVTGAETSGDALLAARAICSSVLVRCSLYGKDPYWGRIVSEAGASGAAFDAARVGVTFGGTTVCEGGISIAHDLDSVARHMDGDEVLIGCHLGLGSGAATMYTCDLGPAYIDENMGTS